MTHLRRIVVTGANKGIGLALVEKILHETADTFIYVGARDITKGEAAVAHLVAQQPAWTSRLAPLALDVSDPESIANAAASLQTIELFGLVNNAGVASSVLPCFNTNVFGVINVTKALRPMLTPVGARIVHVSSGVAPTYVAKCSLQRQAFFTNSALTVEEVEREARAFIAALQSAESDGGAALAAGGYPSPPDAQAAYGASKAFLNAYMLAEVNEEGPESKVVINACSPGFIVTDLTRGFFAKQGAAEGEADEAVTKAGGLPASHGANAPFFLLFGDTKGSGKFFGSDCKRSPLDKYRAPGSAEYAD